jgi:hypothetical protein
MGNKDSPRKKEREARKAERALAKRRKREIARAGDSRPPAPASAN